MSDVNTFIDTIGKDINATVSPQIERLAQKITATTFEHTGRACPHSPASSPRTSSRSSPRPFAISPPPDPGDLPALPAGTGRGAPHADRRRGARGDGRDVRLDLKRRDTGAAVSSLDIPVSLTIKVDPLGVTLKNATVTLDVVR